MSSATTISAITNIYKAAEAYSIQYLKNNSNIAKEIMMASAKVRETEISGMIDSFKNS